MNKADRQTQNSADPSEIVYELRVYHACEGKLDALIARFRDHTVRLFAKHEMKDLGFWTPVDEPLRGGTLMYILEHASRQAARQNWESFIADPEWKAVVASSEADGKLVERIDSTYMSRLDLLPRST